MGYNEWSDDENSHGRDKFRPERSYEESGYERRKRGRRSPTPPEERRYKRRPSYSPPPMRHFQSRVRDYKNNPDTDHYIPNYERDGYNPGPRYGSKPEPPVHHSYKHSPNPGANAPMMDMMQPHMMNRPWNGNMGGFPLVDPTQLDYLVSFKQFSDYTKRTAGRRLDEDDISKRFAHYREKFSARQIVQFFEANKEKEWFQEKYHPSISRPRQEDVKERRRRYLGQFLEALEKGEYDQVRYDKIAQSTTTNGEDDDEPDVSGATDEDGNAEYEPHLVIKTVPPTIAREKIIEMCKKVEGFDYLALSEPSPNKKFHRIGWIKFKEGTDIKKRFEELDNQKVDDFVFHLALNRKNMSQGRVPRIAPEITNTTERLQKDLEQAKELTTALEAVLGEDLPEGLKAVEARAQSICDKHTEDTIDELEEKDAERWKLKKNLDLIITYLRHVHMYCYYCGLESDSLEELGRKCVDPHCRTIHSTDETKNERAVVNWEKNLDHRISLKIHTPDDRELEKMGGRILQSEIDDYIKEHVLKEHESKYKCQVGECSKAFKGIDYVEKHILAKHPEEIERIKTEVEYFNNYVCDPNHIVPNTNNNNNNNQMNQTMMPMTPFPQPYMMGAPRLPAAMAGTPFDQIPRVGFDPAGWSRRPRTSSSSAYADLESSLPKDPRQITSYVDLDAPAEGDANISFY